MKWVCGVFGRVRLGFSQAKRPLDVLIRALQCKWGRHCCRPHSHRRVDVLTLARSPANLRPLFSSAHTWRPMSNPCLPGLATGTVKVSPPALAPASGFRSCPAASAGARSLLLPLPCAVAWPSPRSFTDHKDCGLGAFADPLHFCPARFLACPMLPRRAVLKRACLHSAEASCMPSLDQRVDDFTAISVTKTIVTSRPCGFPFRLVCVLKTS